MSLPSGGDLKGYLRIETAAEDALLDELVEQATAQAASLIGRPILSEEMTFLDVSSEYDAYGRQHIAVPVWPVASLPAPVVTDSNGDVVSGGTYTLDSIGRIVANVGTSFSGYPYSLTVSVGLENHPSYGTKYEPRVNALILGLASVMYYQRNPNASSNSSGGGVSVSYMNNEMGLPPYLAQIVKGLRLPRIR